MQVCLSVATLEDELVEDLETIVIAATGIHGISVSGSPVTLEVHSRECELIMSNKCKRLFLLTLIAHMQTV